jgi:cysteine synthase
MSTFYFIFKCEDNFRNYFNVDIIKGYHVFFNTPCTFSIKKRKANKKWGAELIRDKTGNTTHTMAL